MVSMPVLRTSLSASATAYTLYLLLASPALRSTIIRLFSPTTHPLRFLALATALLLNAKSLPFTWHIRLFHNLIYQLHLQPAPLPKDALFRPIVTTGGDTPLAECDYNFHKSNSTYFADLDISRTQLLTCLLRKGIREGSSAGRPTRVSATGVATAGATATAQDYVPPAAGRYVMALGGVTCHFKRELKPYERFEIWTRLLSWDRKWLYLVSHVVKAGVVRPEEWALHPWDDGVGRAGTAEGLDGDAADEETRKRFQGAVFASSIAKYVVKKGRLTIPPEFTLNNCGLLPRKSTGLQNGDVNGTAMEHDGDGTDEWTWEAVEKQRLHGLQIAEHFAGLDALHAEFPVAEPVAGSMGKERGKIRALGRFRDYPLPL